MIEKFNSLDLRVRYAAFGLCLLAVSGLDYALLMQFQLGGLGKINEDIKKMSEEVVRVKTDIQKIGDINRGFENTRSQLQEMSGKIRSAREVPAVLEDIFRTANESGVRIDQLVPAKEGPEVLSTNAGTKYYTLPIVINAHSGYHMFGRFLNKLESGNVLFLVRNLRMESNGAKPANLSVQAILNVVLADKAPESMPAVAQQIDFVYDIHGKRDPFGPLVSSGGAVLAYDAELAVSDMNLEGVLADPKGNNLAIINGKVVKTADRIGPWQVEAIGIDNADLVKDGQRIKLKLKKGGT